jgi:hypothetical protein
MKVIANETLLHEGQHVAPGEVIDLPEDAVRALGSSVTPQPSKAKGQQQEKTSEYEKTEEPVPPQDGEPAPTATDAKVASVNTETTKGTKQ